MKPKTKTCCEDLQLIHGNFECHLQYVPRVRQYILKIQNLYIKKGKLYQDEFSISHCPWCGSELPKSLVSEWYSIIEEHFGFTDYMETEVIKKLPKEFKTDEWWKNRGL